MKILHFFPFFSIHANGGTEIFIKNLVRYQNSKGYDVQIICPNTCEEVKVEYLENIKLTYFPFPYGTKDQLFISGKSNHTTNLEFEKIVNCIKPDIIHLHGYHTAYHKYFSGLKKDYILLLTPHLLNIICPKGNFINDKGDICDGKVEIEKCAKCVSFSKYKRINKGLVKSKISFEALLISRFNFFYEFKIFSLVKNVIARHEVINFFKDNFYIDALTPWFYKILLNNGFSVEKIRLFPNPLFMEKNYSIKKKARQGHGAIKFLYVGRISAEKGCEMLTDALGSLTTHKSGFTIDMFGKIDDSSIQRKINVLKQSGFTINLMGEIPNKELKFQYLSHDYLLFPSSKWAGEMFPLVIQEAIESKLPIICSDIPGCKQIIKDKVNGLLFVADDKNDFLRVLEDVITGRSKVQYDFDETIDIKEKRNEYYDDFYLELSDLLEKNME